MVTFFYCCLFAAMLLSCANEPKQMTENTNMEGTHVTTVKEAPTADTGIELQIESFNLPPQAAGCSGVFAADSASLQGEQYMFVSNLQGTAYVKINGQLLPLTAADTTAGNGLHLAYNSNGLTVNFTSKQTKKAGDELWQHEGELHIKRGSHEIKMPLIGLVGC